MSFELKKEKILLCGTILIVFVLQLQFILTVLLNY